MVTTPAFSLDELLEKPGMEMVQTRLIDRLLDWDRGDTGWSFPDELHGYIS